MKKSKQAERIQEIIQKQEDKKGIKETMRQIVYGAGANYSTSADKVAAAKILINLNED